MGHDLRSIRLPVQRFDAGASSRVLATTRKALRNVPEVVTAVSKAGQPEDGTDPKTISMAEIFVDIKPPNNGAPA